MSLLERCRNIRVQIERRNALRLAHKEAEAFRERADEVRVARTQVAAEVRKLVVLEKNGVIVTTPPVPTAAVELLRELQSRLASNAEDSGKDYGRLKRSVDKVHKELLSVSGKALDTINRDLPTIEETFLRQVELIPSYAERVARIREQRDRLPKVQDVGSMSADDLQQFLDRRNSFRALTDQLNPSEFPRDVFEFFKATRQGGAPLDKFTTAVREWLAERSLLKNVRVIFQR